jgi:hypothetical protein
MLHHDSLALAALFKSTPGQITSVDLLITDTSSFSIAYTATVDSARLRVMAVGTPDWVCRALTPQCTILEIRETEDQAP